MVAAALVELVHAPGDSRIGTARLAFVATFACRAFWKAIHLPSTHGCAVWSHGDLGTADAACRDPWLSLCILDFQSHVRPLNKNYWQALRAGT